MIAAKAEEISVNEIGARHARVEVFHNPPSAGRTRIENVPAPHAADKHLVQRDEHENVKQQYDELRPWPNFIFSQQVSDNGPLFDRVVAVVSLRFFDFRVDAAVEFFTLFGHDGEGEEHHPQQDGHVDHRESEIIVGVILVQVNQKIEQGTKNQILPDLGQHKRMNDFVVGPGGIEPSSSA